MVDVSSLHTIQNVDAPQQRPSRQGADFDARQAVRSGGGRSADGRSGTTDVDRATQRLDDLLLRDGENGPRKDVPARGFYLNIVV